MTTPYFFDWLDHPTYGDYWRRWSIDEDYERLLTPALHIAGWYDIFLSGTVGNLCHGRKTLALLRRLAAPRGRADPLLLPQ